MERSEDSAPYRSRNTSSPGAGEEQCASLVPGCILLAIGALLVLLLAVGWLI
jgi:hypothetical protein